MRLERFRTAKEDEILALRAAAERDSLPAPRKGTRPDFLAALRRRSSGAPLAVVAEYKRASPSRGVICAHVDVRDAARQYVDAGASALSILTEEAFFQGRLDHLDAAGEIALAPGRETPLLRKDFVFDPLQVAATAATPASALLLIARLTPDARVLRDLREQAWSFGMRAVVEVFDADDLRLARESGAEIIQVNARDLETLKTDRGACLALARENPPASGEVWIAASGMDAPEHLRAAADAGFSAGLVGTALMKDGEPGGALRALLGGAAGEDGA